ncbi:MAG TPA: GntR family transcriptional regulator [Ktedonobacterales bacterium]|nr:GntR family transcriptional regulator [Ktedonobacterales bacterium]
MATREAPPNEQEPPTITLDLASPQPIYLQIVEQVRRHVAEGRLAPGEPLPSVRQLAADLGVNVNTALAAYRALEAEGIVLLRRGARATIHPRLAQTPVPQPDDIARIRAALERARTDALLAGLTPTMLRALATEVFGEAEPTGA